MSETGEYVTAIPPDARASPVDSPDAYAGMTVRYYVGDEQVGVRVFSDDGHLELEYTVRDGKKHGWLYRWDGPGRLKSATPYENGLEHGTALQWADDGTLIGSYTMDHGTGIDLWWIESGGRFVLSEARQVQDGLMTGFEYWFCGGSPEPLAEEKWWFEGRLHGVERRWNLRGRLHRGYPKYWIGGQNVSKRQYVRAATKDITLKPFRPEDNMPWREFPHDVAVHMPFLDGNLEMQRC